MATRIKSAGARSGIEPPQLPTKPSGTSLPNDLLEYSAVYKGLLLAGISLGGQSAEDVTFEKSQLRSVSLAATQLKFFQMHDTRLDSCDLAAAGWDGALLSRAELIGCRMAGWIASNAEFRNVLIKGCNASGAQFWASTFKNVRFEQCILRDVDFQRADLSGVVFERCDLSGAKLSEAKLVGADLRSSTIEGARVGIKELQGTIVNVEQAISIARLLGLVVRMD